MEYLLSGKLATTVFKCYDRSDRPPHFIHAVTEPRFFLSRISSYTDRILGRSRPTTLTLTSPHPPPPSHIPSLYSLPIPQNPDFGIFYGIPALSSHHLTYQQILLLVTILNIKLILPFLLTVWLRKQKKDGMLKAPPRCLVMTQEVFRRALIGCRCLKSS